jgi:hypothetical protein
MGRVWSKGFIFNLSLEPILSSGSSLRRIKD